MGLAASQARLLLLTGRKDDVEGNLMFLANQKLSLSRKSADLSREYANALQATTLMWRNASAEDVPLTYGLLMNYNQVNTEGQYMIADNYSRAVLNSKYADMLMGQGVNSVSPGNLEMSATEFLRSVMGVNESEANYFMNEYRKDQSATTQALNLVYDDTEIVDRLSGQSFVIPTDFNKDGSVKSYGYRAFDSDLSSDDSSVVRFTKAKTQSSREADLYDLIESICGAYSSVETNNSDGTRNKTATVSGGVGGALLDELNPAAKDETAYADAIKEAIEATFDHYANSLEKDYNTKYDYNSSNGVLGAAKQAIGSNQTFRSRDDGGYSTYLDVNQLIKTFMTYFDQACGVKDSGFVDEMYSSDTSINNAHNTYTERNGYTNSTTDNTIHGDFQEASFYIALYNFVNANGATRNESIDKGKGSYLQSLMQNGSLHLVQYQADGTWKTASTSTQDSLLTEEADEDAISEAEAKYDKEKSELDYKESQIDLQVTNLDAERSALETEVDSVKAILNKNIERSFKLFQNG